MVVVLIIFEILLTLRSLISDQILHSLNTNNLIKLKFDGREMVKLLPIHQSQNFTSFMIFRSDQLKFSQVFEISMEPCCTKVAKSLYAVDGIGIYSENTVRTICAPRVSL